MSETEVEPVKAKKGGVGRILLHILFWLISLSGLLFCVGIVIAYQVEEGGPQRTSFWALTFAATLIPALFFNPLIWKLFRRAMHPAVTTLLGLALGVALLFSAFSTPFGAFLSANDSNDLRAAAAKGSSDAQYSLAIELLKAPDTPPDEGMRLLKQAISGNHARAQALFVILNMGLNYEGRQLERNDRIACGNLWLLQNKPEFAGQNIPESWTQQLEEESRFRGWRLPGDPEGPLNCTRASLNPPAMTFSYLNPQTPLPEHLHSLPRVEGVVECTIMPDGGTSDCSLTSETPEGYGVGDWAMTSARESRLSDKDIYGWPTAGRRLELVFFAD